MILDINKLAARIDILYELKDLLYSQPECSCGGPLHIILDDCNILDQDIEFCRERILEEKWSNVRELCVCILDMLSTLTEAQRLCWWEYRALEEIYAAKDKNIKSTLNGYELAE